MSPIKPLYRVLAPLILMGTLLAAPPLHAGDDGMQVVASDHDVATTADRLVSILEDKGMTVYARIDHAAGAVEADMELAPTQLVIFGNPHIGTRLMQCDRRAGIDLPVKVLIWEDKDGVHLGYNSAKYLAKRHDLRTCGTALGRIAHAIASFVHNAAR